jgi:uncharacterized PurR-regulated membrane protein YhhQ (DUF165 family)
MNSPTTLQAVILGLCLGAIYGLFFYQRYRRQYFWILSAAAGILSSALANLGMKSLGMWDNYFMLAALCQIALPSLGIVWLNRLLSKQKRRRRTSEDLSEVVPSHSFTSFL